MKRYPSCRRGLAAAVMTEERHNGIADLEPGVENRLRKAVLSGGPRPVQYLEYLAEREELLKHKWLESEKAGHDIGAEKAFDSWVSDYRMNWLRHRISRLRQNTKRN